VNDLLPQRKPTRLENFDYSTAGAYFLTICTKERKPLLSTLETVGDGALDIPLPQLTAIGQIVEKYIRSTNCIKGVTVDRYVIMPDHIHMIVFVSPSEDNASGTSRAPSPTNQAIPHVVSTLKRFCNREIGCNVFQRSYNDHIIRDEEDYQTRCKYLEENPLRWSNGDRE